jgi:hypothetical protein
MRTLEQFLDTLKRETTLDADEQARYAALWPAASSVADRCEQSLPSAPRFSPRRRRQVFFDLCQRIDELQAAETLNDEQAQLVLTLLRSRLAAYRRAETSFIAWARSVDRQELANAPLTARQLLIGIHHYQQQHQ